MVLSQSQSYNLSTHNIPPSPQATTTDSQYCSTTTDHQLNPGDIAVPVLQYNTNDGVGVGVGAGVVLILKCFT